MRELRDFFVFVFFISMGAIGICAVFALPWFIWGDSRVEDIKEHANSVIASHGLTKVGYEGFTLGIAQQPGGCVWYTMTKGNILYNGCISKWGNEYHLYSLRAIDAISPKN